MVFQVLGLFGGAAWADHANEGMFGNNGVGFGEPSSLGASSRDGQALGHTILPFGMSASNWSGAPNYSNMGEHVVYAIPDSGATRGYPMSNWGRSGQAAWKMIHSDRPAG